MGAFDQPRTAPVRWPYLVPIGLGLFLTLIALFWLPWERVHPADASLHELLGYAPFWSHRFTSVPGAHIDWSSFLISLCVIWVLCAVAFVMLKMSTTKD